MKNNINFLKDFGGQTPPESRSKTDKKPGISSSWPHTKPPRICHGQEDGFGGLGPHLGRLFSLKIAFEIDFCAPCNNNRDVSPLAEIAVPTFVILNAPRGAIGLVFGGPDATMPPKMYQNGPLY